MDVAVELIYGVRGKSLKLLGEFEYIADAWSWNSYLHRTWFENKDSVAVYEADCPFPKEKRFIGSFKVKWGSDTVMFVEPRILKKEYSKIFIRSW